MEKNPIQFPNDFLWGTAVCSHQAEGYNVHSDWWEWEQKGKIADGTVSGPAADMLHRYPEDFELMEKLGYNAFRFSVEWARIEPRQGRYSEEALTHYVNVLKEMKKRSIKSCVTLYHWVLPKWAADLGGWTNPQSVDWFREYSRRVVERIYPEVDLWCTLNEPMAPIFAGYLLGVFPPEKRDFLLAARVFKNLLRAHAAAYEVIMQEAKKRLDPKEPLIGIAHALIDFQAKNPDSFFQNKIVDSLRFLHNTAFVRAMKTGRVPFPLGFNEAIPGLAESFNYMGVNYYLRLRPDIPLTRIPRRMEDLAYIYEGMEYTEMGPWYEVYPPGFFNVLKEMSVFGRPIYITENGCADATDHQRPGYLLRHLKQLRRAMDAGIDIRGYFQWSYIDNFEWQCGFEKKLGVVELEPGTLNRKPRPSAYMYGEIARANQITPELARKYAPAVENELWE